jgi:hypothetical protein
VGNYREKALFKKAIDSNISKIYRTKKYFSKAGK